MFYTDVPSLAEKPQEQQKQPLESPQTFFESKMPQTPYMQETPTRPQLGRKYHFLILFTMIPLR